MARPKKEGLDYFPLDVDFFSDEKIEAISGEFGIKGEITALRLLCAIYRNGYFIQWNEMLKMKLLKNLPSVSPELLDKIVQRLVRWGFFNELLFNSEKVLTSKGIQVRYLEATKRRKNSLCKHYDLINSVNVYNNLVTSAINVDINAQSKVKESKEKENKKNSFKNWTHDDFKNEVREASLHIGNVPDSIKHAFDDYWTELSPSGVMKFQLQATWETSKRLKTWLRNKDRW